MLGIDDLELSDFISIWTLQDGKEVTVCFSCWTREEASRAAQKLHELTSCPASIELHDALSDKCLPRLAPDRLPTVGWVVYFPKSPEDQDWTAEQLEGFDEWLLTALVNIEGASYLPTGSLEGREGPPLNMERGPALRTGMRGPFKSFENALANAQLLASEKGVDVKIRHQDAMVTNWFLDWDEPPPRPQIEEDDGLEAKGIHDDHWPPYDDGGFFHNYDPDPVAALIEYEQEEIRRESYDGSPFGVEEYARAEDSGWYDD